MLYGLDRRETTFSIWSKIKEKQNLHFRNKIIEKIWLSEAVESTKKEGKNIYKATKSLDLAWNLNHMRNLKDKTQQTQKMMQFVLQPNHKKKYLKANLEWKRKTLLLLQAWQTLYKNLLIWNLKGAFMFSCQVLLNL